MSEQEEKLQRLQAWDDYRAAKNTYLASQRKLSGLAEPLIRVGQRLTMGPLLLDLEEANSIPTGESLVAAVQDFRKAAAQLKRTWATAREFGFNVDPGDLKGLEKI